MKSVENAHVLVVPSRYDDSGRPVPGRLFRTQVALTHSLGVRTGVVFPDLGTFQGSRSPDWFARRFQVVEEIDGGVPTLRVMGWNIPGAAGLTRGLWISQVQRLIKKYIRRHGVPDLLHAHGVHEAGVAVLAAKRDWKIPFIIAVRSAGYERGVTTDAMEVRAMDVFSQADRIVAVNRAVAGDIKSYVGNRDITIIPDVVESEPDSDERAIGAKLIETYNSVIQQPS